MTHSDNVTSVHSELARLRARVIALENLTIALLTNASTGQSALIHDIPAFTTPHPARHAIP
jgi:hypothetical protein